MTGFSQPIPRWIGLWSNFTFTGRPIKSIEEPSPVRVTPGPPVKIGKAEAAPEIRLWLELAGNSVLLVAALGDKRQNLMAFHTKRGGMIAERIPLVEERNPGVQLDSGRFVHVEDWDI